MRPVITAPGTSTAATSVTCARATAANQTVTNTDRIDPVSASHAHCAERERNQIGQPTGERQPADEQHRTAADPTRADRRRRHGFDESLHHDQLDRPADRCGQDHRLADTGAERADTVGERDLPDDQQRNRADVERGEPLVRAASRPTPPPRRPASCGGTPRRWMWPARALRRTGRRAPLRRSPRRPPRPAVRCIDHDRASAYRVDGHPRRLDAIARAIATSSIPATRFLPVV